LPDMMRPQLKLSDFNIAKQHVKGGSKNSNA